MLNVLIITPQDITLEGKARCVILPGEQGVFEVLPGHKQLVSRLITGRIKVDDKEYTVKRGVVKVDEDKVVIVMEDIV